MKKYLEPEVEIFALEDVAAISGGSCKINSCASNCPADCYKIDCPTVACMGDHTYG